MATNINDPNNRQIHCPKCDTVSYHRIKRSLFVKRFLPWFPFQRFFCYKCLSAFYVKADVLERS